MYSIWRIKLGRKCLTATLFQVRLKFTLVVTGVEKNYPNNEYEMARFTYDQSDKFSDKVTLLSGSASLTFSYNVSLVINGMH